MRSQSHMVVWEGPVVGSALLRAVRGGTQPGCLQLPFRALADTSEGFSSGLTTVPGGFLDPRVQGPTHQRFSPGLGTQTPCCDEGCSPVCDWEQMISDGALLAITDAARNGVTT